MAVVGKPACVQVNNVASCAVLYESFENLLFSVLLGLFAMDSACFEGLEIESPIVVFRYVQGG